MLIKSVEQRKVVSLMLYALIVAGVAGFGVKLAINVGSQLPAPVGDSVLFASATFGRCARNIYETPIFPLDPSGASRYIWHGFLSPAIHYSLMPSCDISSMFVAHSVILVGTAILAVVIVLRSGGTWSAALILALTCVALQSKVQFRPETVAILFSLLAEFARRKWHPAVWAVFVCAIAWTHPIASILYVAYACLSTDKAELLLIRKAVPIGLIAVVAFNGIIAYLYPFPLNDLLEGILIQGRNFSHRTDGSLITYFVRSDFFPFFGLALLVTLALRCFARPFVIFLLPLIWFFVLRVPPGYYNSAPLLVVWLYCISAQPNPADVIVVRPDFRVAASILVGALGVLGLWQMNARDINSIVTYGVGPSQAVAALRAIEASSKKICGVPAFFTLLDTGWQFTRSFDPRLVGCDDVPSTATVNLRQQAGTSGARHDTCDYPFVGETTTPLGRIFKSDSGYSFYVCPGDTN